MDRKRVFFILVLVFAAVYYLGRLGIFYVASTETDGFEVEVSGLERAVVEFSFLLIGVVGLALLPGLYLKKTWGFWGTIALSIYTIVFDVWAWIAIQPSAAAGIIPAVILIGYLLLVRNEFIKKP